MCGLVEFFSSPTDYKIEQYFLQGIGKPLHNGKLFYEEVLDSCIFPCSLSPGPHPSMENRWAAS